MLLLREAGWSGQVSQGGLRVSKESCSCSLFFCFSPNEDFEIGGWNGARSEALFVLSSVVCMLVLGRCVYIQRRCFAWVVEV